MLETIELDYTRSGTEHNETILFVHGLGADCRQFEKQHDFFSQHYQVISISLRGHGNSSVPIPSSKIVFNLKTMSEDVIRLLNTLKIKQVHYVGNSMGGNIGYELLRNASSRILSLTTFGTTAILKKSKTELIFLKAIYKLLSKSQIAGFSKSAGQSDYSKRMIYKMISESDKSSILNILPNISAFDYRNVIQQSSLPILIIKGSKDKEINKHLASTIAVCQKKAGFRIEEISNAGHFANLDQPQCFNTILINFIKQHTYV